MKKVRQKMREVFCAVIYGQHLYLRFEGEVPLVRCHFCGKEGYQPR